MQSKATVADYPDLAAQWHPTKNGALTSAQVTYGSNRKAWWKCPVAADHEWEAVVSSRTAGRGCPFCAGRRTSSTNSLALCDPEIAAQWHPTKNGALTPLEVTARGDRKVWWQCKKNPEHQWQNLIGNRVRRGQGCPFCRGKKFNGAGSFRELYPEMAEQWDTEKNLPQTPEKIGPHSAFEAWWKCPAGEDHRWQAEVYARTNPKSQGCPFCTNHRACKDNCLATRCPEVAREWHPELNGTMTPETVTWGSNKRAWWLCQFGHVWRTVISGRTGDRRCGCPVCAKRRRRRVATTGARRTAVRLPGYEGPSHGPVVRRRT